MIASYAALKVPGPIQSPVSKPFWEAARRGELALQRCDTCTQWFFYPRTHCPHCWSAQVSWHRASGQGVVKTFSVIHRPGHFAWVDVAPYVIALIELTEGPTMLSQLVVADPDTVTVGQPVVLRCVTVGQFVLPFFELAGAKCLEEGHE